MGLEIALVDRVYARMRIIFLLLLLVSASPSFADQVNLSPSGSQVAFRAYGLGIVPFDGKFTRFHGIVRYDPAHPEKCQIMLNIDAASLRMSDEGKDESVLGPEFMDVARFPDMVFDGACQGNEVVGNLRLHGDTHPFALDLTRSKKSMTAVGRLKRADWGITARPFAVGATIRIRVEFPTPTTEPHV